MTKNRQSLEDVLNLVAEYAPKGGSDVRVHLNGKLVAVGKLVSASANKTGAERVALQFAGGQDYTILDDELGEVTFEEVE